MIIVTFVMLQVCMCLCMYDCGAYLVNTMSQEGKLEKHHVWYVGVLHWVKFLVSFKGPIVKIFYTISQEGMLKQIAYLGATLTAVVNNKGHLNSKLV